MFFKVSFEVLVCWFFLSFCFKYLFWILYYKYFLIILIFLSVLDFFNFFQHIFLYQILCVCVLHFCCFLNSYSFSSKPPQIWFCFNKIVLISNSNSRKFIANNYLLFKKSNNSIRPNFSSNSWFNSILFT